MPVVGRVLTCCVPVAGSILDEDDTESAGRQMNRADRSAFVQVSSLLHPEGCTVNLLYTHGVALEVG